jgi:hypothetical protein
VIVSKIEIRKQGYYGGYSGAPKAETPYDCTIEIYGQSGKVELNLSPELTTRLMAIIGDEVVASSKRTAEAMTAEIITVAALPSPEVQS